MLDEVMIIQSITVLRISSIHEQKRKFPYIIKMVKLHGKHFSYKTKLTEKTTAKHKITTKIKKLVLSKFKKAPTL